MERGPIGRTAEGNAQRPAAGATGIDEPTPEARFAYDQTHRYPTVNPLSHFDDRGASRMVDVGEKPETRRSATASATIRMAPATLALIQNKELAKGDVLEVARIAGIQAAKKTGELIPLCHPLLLTAIRIELTCVPPDAMIIEATVEVFARTGVEMEALTAVSIAALTVYDMVKAVDRGMWVESIRLEKKSGGRSGDYQRELGEPEA